MSKTIMSIIVIGCLLSTSIATVNAFDVTHDEAQADVSGHVISIPYADVYVDDSADPGGDGSYEHPFQFIQDGVDAATDGDIIYVFNGTYYENVEINKPLTLRGKKKDNTIIEGSISISNTNGVTIKGFTITKNYSGYSYIGIWLYDGCSNCTIKDNVFVNCTSDGWITCIDVWDSSNNMITGNLMLNNFADGIYGIDLKSYGGYETEGNIISNNTFKGNKANDFLRAVGLFNANNNIITNNIIKDNGKLSSYPSFIGIRIDMCDEGNIIAKNIIEDNAGIKFLGYSSGIQIDGAYNTVKENTIKNNNFPGIELESIDLSFHSEFNDILNNEINGNRHGIILHWCSSRNNIFENNIVNNDIIGIYILKDEEEYTPVNNNFFYNNLKNNGGLLIGGNAIDQGNNNWDDGEGMGNYWDDYTGNDWNGDGIGDTPYKIPDGDSNPLNNNRDAYPLMEEWPNTYNNYYNNYQNSQSSSSSSSSSTTTTTTTATSQTATSAPTTTTTRQTSTNR